MATESLNDLVVDWGIANESIYSYDPAKYALVGALDQSEVAVYGGAFGYNEGLALLAGAIAVYYGILLETGDTLLLESGDRLLME